VVVDRVLAQAQMQTITQQGFEVLIPPDGTLREGNRPGWENGLYATMRRLLPSADKRSTGSGRSRRAALMVGRGGCCRPGWRRP
jgi:hypothetical protein